MRAVDSYVASVTFGGVNIRRFGITGSNYFLMSPEAILNRFNTQSLVCDRGIDVKHLNIKNNVLLIRDYKQLLEE